MKVRASTTFTPRRKHFTGQRAAHGSSTERAAPAARTQNGTATRAVMARTSSP